MPAAREMKGTPWNGIRWMILALIFAVTCINYIDRSSIGLLVTRFGGDIGITTRQYGYISSLLLAAYTVSQSLSGRLYDRFGARAGFTVSIVVWCAAAMAHSLMTGVVSFALCSFFLGLGEAGNWPGAAKVIAEWFPQRERAIGMAIFNGGASMGAVLGPLLVAGLLEPRFGWRVTFAIIGLLGFIWLAAWLFVYHPLFQHPHLTSRERALIREGQPSQTVDDVKPVSVRALLAYKQTWAILLARFCVDPVWWLYMLWLPTYLKDVRHFSLKDIGISAWAPYAAAAAGALFGGWLSGRLIRGGMSVNAARKTVIVIAACMMPFGIFAARAHSAYAALACISVVLFGFQMWISNVQTLPSDFFSHRSVGVIAGMGGTAAGVASLMFNLLTAPMAHRFGYGFVLTLAGLLAPIGLVLLLVLAGTIRRLDDSHAPPDLTADALGEA
ncbi:MAG TPA: MFS transporter [Acidobacteriaceae bacterium]|jgi:ACS family hexuronate transporter-like MFS transporter